LLGARAAHEVLHRRGDQAPRLLDPEGPREGPASQRQVEALGHGVQVRTAAWGPARRIGDDLEAGSPVGGDDSQQIGLRGPLPTPDAGADTAPDLRSGAARRACGHATEPRFMTAVAEPSSSLAFPGARTEPTPYRTGATWSGATGSGASSERMSMRQPVSRAASRAFCPSLPIANDSW